MNLQHFSSYCQTALPILGMVYTGMLIYESRNERGKLLKQVFSFGLFAALAYANAASGGAP